MGRRLARNQVQVALGAQFLLFLVPQVPKEFDRSQGYHSALVSGFGIVRAYGRVYLLRAAARSAASVLQSFIKAVQLVAKVAESDLFRPQLLLSFYFSRLSLLLFIFQGFKSCLELPKTILSLFPLSDRILCIAYEIFVLLDIASHMLPLILNSRELIPCFIEALGGVGDSRFLSLQPIDENLRSLPRNGCGLQILPQLAYFR